MSKYKVPALFRGGVFVDVNTIANVTRHAKRGLMGIAKCIDPGQPAQSAQSDHGRNFSLLPDFLRIMR